MNKPTTLPVRSIARPTLEGSGILQAWRQLQGPEQLRRHSRKQGRSYAGAAYNRQVADWIAQSTSADSELQTSLRALRNRSRQLARDNEYAGHLIDRVIPNNVVGQGVRFQAQVKMRRGGRLNEAVNSVIEAKWDRWSRANSCHVAGKLAFQDIERMIMRNVPESGELLVRMVRKPFGSSRIPFALEVIEADQLVDNWSGRTQDGREIRMGVEVDEWQRPVAYWLYPRHPGDFAFAVNAPSNQWQRVPAEEIIHLAIWDRPLQTRGVPWLHNALIKLRHIGGTEEALIVRARAAACIMGFIQSPEIDDGMPGQNGDDAMQSDDIMDGEKVYDMQSGIIKELGPGETFEGFAPTGIDQAVDPFMRFMLRGVATGVGVSYESLSRDYSQSNYSSSRLALTEDRDHWRVLQRWLVRQFHQRVYEAWLEMAVWSGELDLPGYDTQPEIYQDVRWAPRGWDWIDPLKEVTAAKLAVRSGFASNDEIIGAKGGDIEDVYKQLRRERDMAADLNLVIETDPAQVDDKGIVQGMDPVQETDTGVDADGNPIADGDGPTQDDAASGDDAATQQTQAGGARLAQRQQLERLELLQESHLLKAVSLDDRIDALRSQLR